MDLSFLMFKTLVPQKCASERLQLPERCLVQKATVNYLLSGQSLLGLPVTGHDFWSELPTVILRHRVSRVGWDMEPPWGNKPPCITSALRV